LISSIILVNYILCNIVSPRIHIVNTEVLISSGISIKFEQHFLLMLEVGTSVTLIFVTHVPQ